MAATLGPQTLREALTDRHEFALLDVRERGEYARGHLFLAINLPLSHLELRIRRYVPRLSARIILCDDATGLSERAADVLEDIGYTRVSLIEGGAPACAQAGLELYRAHYVVTYAFGLHVAQHYRLPLVSARELQEQRDAGEPVTVLDSRPIWDFEHATIPQAIDVPLGELAYRIRDAVPDARTRVVVNCGAVTRGCLGAQSLIEAGVDNPVAVLENGVRGWELAGFAPERGADRRAEPASEQAVVWAREAAARLRTRFDIKRISPAQLDEWRSDEKRTLFVVDVRTRHEYETGHLPDAIWILASELIGLYEDHVGTLNARVCLVDDDESRATVAASWLLRMGWPDVVVLEGGIHEHELTTGPETWEVPGLTAAAALPRTTPEELQSALEQGTILLLDVDTSNAYAAGHIPGAWWTVRANLPKLMHKLPVANRYAVTSNDGKLAQLAAADLRALTQTPVVVLAEGTAAWRDAGLPMVGGMTRTLGEIDDALPELNVRPGDDPVTARAAQLRMVAWQEELLTKLERDETFSFPALT